MIDKHVGYNGDKMKDFATVEELADEIDFVLHNGEWKKQGDSYAITIGENRVIIKRIFDKKEKNWVVTAYEKERTQEEKGIVGSNDK